MVNNHTIQKFSAQVAFNTVDLSQPAKLIRRELLSLIH